MADDFNVFEYLAHCRAGLEQGLALFERVRAGASSRDLVHRFVAVMQPEVGNARKLADLPDLAACRDALLDLSDAMRDAVAIARELII